MNSFSCSANCLLDHGDYFNKDEYQSHVSLMPGQLHTPDEQCKLLRGEDSGICSVSYVNHWLYIVNALQCYSFLTTFASIERPT